MKAKAIICFVGLVGIYASIAAIAAYAGLHGDPIMEKQFNSVLNPIGFVVDARSSIQEAISFFLGSVFGLATSVIAFKLFFEEEKLEHNRVGHILCSIE